MPGHSAFNLQVFWKHPPKLMLPQLIGPANPLVEKQTPGGFDLYVLQNLLNEKQFRDGYRPVLMHLGDGEIFAYARADSLMSTTTIRASCHGLGPVPAADDLGHDLQVIARLRSLTATNVEVAHVPPSSPI